ncbi:NAD-binding protein [uncultured Roseibium sp.]|uniref:NAD-binding protein n=1 Tax=uncultured Roseibium sp. TaxID=1936171 RepID=UPI003216F0C0
MIAGMGQHGKAFADSTLAAGRPVISIATSAQRKLAKGHIPLERDATEPDAWRNIAVETAKALVLTLPSNAANLTALSAVLKTLKPAEKLVGHAQNPLTIHVALEDGQTRNAFLENEEALKPFPGCEVRPYSVSELIARRFFSEVPVHARARALGHRRLHMVFAGRGPVNQALILQFLKICPAYGFDMPKLSLVSEEPENWHDELLNDYPGIETLAEFDLAVWHKKYAHPAADDLKRIEDGGAVTSIFVDLGEGEHNAVAARLLRAFCRRESVWRAPTYFQARRGANLAHFFDETGDAIPDPIQPLSSAETVCTLTAIDGTDDREARQVHTAYRQERRDSNGAAALPWEQLTETHRAASRRAADYQPVLEESLSAAREERSTGPASLAAETRSDETTLRTALEHASWCNERILAGWRFGSSRDDERMFHPDLPEATGTSATATRPGSQLDMQ